MADAVLEADEDCGAVGGKPRGRDTQQLQLSPAAATDAGLLRDILYVQQFVAQELLQCDPFPPVPEQNLGEIGKTAKPVTAEQQLLILSQPRAFLVTPTAKPLDAPHPQRMPQGKAPERRADDGGMVGCRVEAPERAPVFAEDQGAGTAQVYLRMSYQESHLPFQPVGIGNIVGIHS